MRYLFLLYGDPDGEAALTADERWAVVQGHVNLGKELAGAGRLHAAEALGDGVRVVRADGSVTDGPYAETKEQLGSVYLVDVEDEAAALDLARRMPPSPGLVVEVHPVLEV
jgi:hypothetical protein